MPPPSTKPRPIKKTTDPVSLAFKHIVGIVLAPRHYADAGCNTVAYQGTLQYREDLDARMRAAVTQRTVGRKMAASMLSRFEDELVAAEDTPADRAIAARRIGATLGPQGGQGGCESGDPDACYDDDDGDDADEEDDDADSGMDMEDDEDDEGRLQRRGSKSTTVHFALYLPADALPLIAPCIRYHCGFASGGNGGVFPPKFEDLEVLRVSRTKAVYTWGNFGVTVARFAPHIMKDLHARQQVTRYVGPSKEAITGMPDLARIPSRVFRSTAAAIFQGAFRPPAFFKVFMVLHPRQRQPLGATNDDVEQLYGDLRDRAHIFPHITPLFNDPICLDAIGNNLREFKSVKQVIKQAHRHKRRRRNRDSGGGSGSNNNGGGGDDDGDDRAPADPLGDIIYQVHQIWSHIIDQSLRGAYLTELPMPPPEDLAHEAAMVDLHNAEQATAIKYMEDNLILKKMDDNLYASADLVSMVRDIHEFMVAHADNMMISEGRGTDMDDVILDWFVRRNREYPTKPSNRLLLCPTLTATHRAAAACSHTVVNMGNFEAIRSRLRQMIFVETELIIIDGAHLYGIFLLHKIILLLDEVARARRCAPSIVICGGSRADIIGRTHITKWPVFADMLGTEVLPEVIMTPHFTSNDLIRSAASGETLPLHNKTAFMKILAYDDKEAPAFKRGAGATKWVATDTPAVAARVGEYLNRYREQMHEAGCAPLILFDNAQTMRAVQGQSCITDRVMRAGGVVMSEDGGQGILGGLYEIKPDKSTMRLDSNDHTDIHAYFTAYRFAADPLYTRRRLAREPIRPLEPTTVLTCRATPTPYVILVVGTKYFKQEDIAAAIYHTTQRLVVLAPKAAVDECFIASRHDKRNIFDALIDV